MVSKRHNKLRSRTYCIHVFIYCIWQHYCDKICRSYCIHVRAQSGAPWCLFKMHFPVQCIPAEQLIICHFFVIRDYLPPEDCDCT